MAILETKDLRKIYGSGENEVHALDGVSISVDEGEFVAVVGTSGSGKSTLNMIGGLDRPTSGSVTIRGKELLKMKDEELTIFRRRNIGFVFQNYNLLPVLNVYENIVYPIEIDGAKADTEFVRQIIHTLGLEKKLKNMPNNLSAACSDCPCIGYKARYYPCRRADWQSGLQNEYGCYPADAVHQQTIPSDHHYDYSQRRNRSDGRPHNPH